MTIQGGEQIPLPILAPRANPCPFGLLFVEDSRGLHKAMVVGNIVYFALNSP